MVKVRIEGLSEDVAAFIQEMRDKDFHILMESKEYPNKNSEYVRVYVEVK